MSEGLKLKYHLTKADGRPVDPEGVYFVLKLNSHDPAHRRASIAAARIYSGMIAYVNRQLADDLLAVCDKIALGEKPPAEPVHPCVTPYSELAKVSVSTGGTKLVRECGDEVLEDLGMAETYPGSGVLNFGEVALKTITDWCDLVRGTEHDCEKCDIESIKQTMQGWWKKRREP